MGHLKLRKVLVFGCNAFALEVINQLSGQDCDLVMVSSDGVCLERVAEKGCRVIETDYTDDEVLRELGIGSDVDVVFAVFDDDAKNVFLTISCIGQFLQHRDVNPNRCYGRERNTRRGID